MSNMAQLVGENAPVMTDYSIGANELAMHNCHPDTEYLDLHRWKMKNFYMDSEVLQLPIKLISKQTLCKMIGLLCSELQTCGTSREPDVKSSQSVNNDLKVKDQNSTIQRKSEYIGKNIGSDFLPIRHMKPCSFCSQIHFWGKSRCPSFGKRCNYCNIFNHNETSCWFKQMDNLNQVNENNWNLSNQIKNERRKSKCDQTSSLSISGRSNIEETKKPQGNFNIESHDVPEAELTNVEAHVAIEAVISSDSSTIKSLEASDHDKPLESSEEPHKKDFASEEIVDDDVSTHIPAEGPVNIRSFDEESWLLGMIETESDPYWFKNKCFRQRMFHKTNLQCRCSEQNCSMTINYCLNSHCQFL